MVKTILAVVEVSTARLSQ